MNILQKLARRAQVNLDWRFMSPLAKSVSTQKITYLVPQKINRLEKTISAVHKRGVLGAFAEFGVAMGGSAIILASAALAQDRQFHGFDVFGLIPPPTDKDGPDVHDRYATITSGRSKGIGGDPYYGYRDDLLGFVKSKFAENGVPVDQRQVFLHKGLFDQTWPPLEGTALAIMHIDCDWYEPVKYCLGIAERNLRPGGCVILDDYHDYSGCKEATDEFLAANKDYSLIDGRNVLLERRIV